MSTLSLMGFTLALGICVGLLIGRLVYRGYMRWPGDHS